MWLSSTALPARFEAGLTISIPENRNNNDTQHRPAATDQAGERPQPFGTSVSTGKDPAHNSIQHMNKCGGVDQPLKIKIIAKEPQARKISEKHLNIHPLLPFACNG